MAAFAAIVLVCLSEVTVADCSRETALEVRAVEVENELGCVSGWQEIIARTPAARQPGPSTHSKSTYLKTLCERVRPRGQ